MRVIVELLYLGGGLVVAAAMTAGAAWAYPMGRDVIWLCGAAAMAATIAMGVMPLRRAIAADRMPR